MKRSKQHPLQQPLLNRQTTEMQNLLTLWGQEVVVNEKVMQHQLQHPLFNRQITEVQDLLTLWGQEVVVNEKVIAESTVE